MPIEKVSFAPQGCLPLHGSLAHQQPAVAPAQAEGAAVRTSRSFSSPWHAALQLSRPQLSRRPHLSQARPGSPDSEHSLQRERRTPQSGADPPPAPHGAPPHGFLFFLLNTGFAGPGISGKINSGGEKLTWFLGVFVFWQAVRGGADGEFGAGFFSFFAPFRCQTNEENPAIGAREPGVRLLGGR